MRLKTYIYILFALLLASCGTDSHHFRVEGHLLNMNYGEFYVYSPDGTISKIDTIHVEGGRFAYQIPCEEEGILVVVTPNFAEIPIFAQPGKTVSIKADAQNLKEMEVKGSSANKEMSEWRKETNGMSPPELKRAAEAFIRENPSSIVSQWMLRKYFVTATTPDLKKASELAKVIMSGSKATKAMSQLANKLQDYYRDDKNERLPAFTAKDIHGKTIASSEYMRGTVIITTMAKWNYDGQNLNRMIRNRLEVAKRDGKTPARIITISLDPSLSEMRSQFTYDSLPWPVICDEKMWESPMVKTLRITKIPYNIIVKDGRIVGRRLKNDDLMKYISE